MDAVSEMTYLLSVRLQCYNLTIKAAWLSSKTSELTIMAGNGRLLHIS